jgi:hypothetical protein
MHALPATQEPGVRAATATASVLLAPVAGVTPVAPGT